MYEHHRERLASRSTFALRVLWHMLVASATLVLSLLIGIVGYRATEGMSRVDATLNASMILGGMGPVNQIVTVAGKIFASVYSLFSGVVFLVAAGVIVAPMAHRLLHRLHLDTQD